MIDTVAITIAITRVAALGVGAFCLWLAYKLFFVNNEHQGHFEGNGFGVSFKLRKVAPGVFFGLFGAAIVVYALQPIRYSKITNGGDEHLVGTPAPRVSEELNATTEVLAGAPMPQVTPKVAKSKAGSK